MQYPMLMTEFNSPQQAEEVLLGIRQANGYGPIVQYVTQIRNGALIDQADRQVAGHEGIDQFDDVLMTQPGPEELDFSDGSEVHPFLWTLRFDLLDGNDPTGLLVPGLLNDSPRTLAEGLDYVVVLHLLTNDDAVDIQYRSGTGACSRGRKGWEDKTGRAW